MIQLPSSSEPTTTITTFSLHFRLQKSSCGNIIITITSIYLQQHLLSQTITALSLTFNFFLPYLQSSRDHIVKSRSNPHHHLCLLKENVTVAWLLFHYHNHTSVPPKNFFQYAKKFVDVGFSIEKVYSICWIVLGPK